MILAAFANALAAVPDGDPHFRIEHAIQVRDDQLPLFLQTKAIASI